MSYRVGDKYLVSGHPEWQYVLQSDGLWYAYHHNRHTGSKHTTHSIDEWVDMVNGPVFQDAVLVKVGPLLVNIRAAWV